MTENISSYMQSFSFLGNAKDLLKKKKKKMSDISMLCSVKVYKTQFSSVEVFSLVVIEKCLVL